MGKLIQATGVRIIIEAPDAYIAAAVLLKANMFMGRGDRSAMIEIVLSSNPSSISDLYHKLKMVTATTFCDSKIFQDNRQEDYQMKFSKKTAYQLWLHCCRKNQVLTCEQMVELCPAHADLIRVWDKYVDAHGKTTLNLQEYAQYRKEMSVKAKKEKL